MKYLAFKKTLIAILSVILIASSAVVYANVVADPSECGVTEDGKVKQIDFSICREDVAFKVIYSVFPKVISDDVLDFFNFKYLSPVAEELKTDSVNYLNQSDTLVHLFKSVNTMMLLLVLIFVFSTFIVGSLKTAQDGKFLGESWNFRKIFVSYAFFFLLLTPTETGVTLFQVLILAAGLLSISVANGIWGAYLYLVSGADQTVSGGNDLGSLEIDRNSPIYYQSEVYVNNIIDSILCTRSSENAQFEAQVGAITENNFGDKVSCVFKERNKGGLEIPLLDKESSSFFVSKYFASQKYTTTSTNIFSGSDFGASELVGSGVEFGSFSVNAGVCEGVEEFSCGGWRVHVPKFPSEEFQEFADSLDFDSVTKSAMASSNNIAALSSSLSSGVETLTSKARAIYSETPEAPLPSAVQKKLKILISAFHQTLFNHATSGVSGVGSSPEIFKGVLLKSNSLVDKIREFECLSKQSDSYLSSGTLMGLNAVRGGQAPSISDGFVKCIDFQNGELVLLGGKDSKTPFDRASESDMQVLSNRISSTASDVLRERQELVDEVFKIRAAVQNSLYESINGIDNGGFYNDIRRKGFFVAGSLILDISKRSSFDKGLIDSTSSSVIYSPSKTVINGVSRDLTSSKTSQSYSYELQERIKRSSAKNYSVSGNYDLASFSDDLYQRMDERASYDESNVFQRFVSFITSPVYQFRKVTGSTGGLGGVTGDLESCRISPESCPIPKVNPMIAITDLGNELLDVSIFMVSTLVATNVVLSTVNVGSGKGIKRDSSGEVVSSGVAFKTNKYTGKALDLLSGASTILFKILFYIGLLGIIFAYVLPLIPFLNFIVAILSWLMLFFQMLIISTIWTTYLLKPVEEGDTNNEVYVSGYNFALQLVARMPLMLIGFILGWMLLQVFLLMINLSLPNTLLSIISGAGTLASLFSTLFILTTYMVIVYLITLYAFSLMKEIPDRLMAKIDGGKIFSSDNLQSKIQHGGFVQAFQKSSGVTKFTMGVKK